MKMNDLIQGLTILQPYYDNPDGHHIEARYEQVFARATDKPVSPDDAAKLRQLGWFQDEVDGECEDGDGEYDPGEVWSAYT